MEDTLKGSIYDTVIVQTLSSTFSIILYTAQERSTPLHYIIYIFDCGRKKEERHGEHWSLKSWLYPLTLALKGGLQGSMYKRSLTLSLPK